MTKYYIKLRDPDADGGWRYYDVPAGASVEDWGVCLKVTRSCRCACGDPHKAELDSFSRDEVLSALVSGDGMSMWIWRERETSPSTGKAT